MTLEDRLQIVLATSYTFALEAQRYHWNVMGTDFHAYHEFYEKIYDEVSEAVDDIAEQIRTRGEHPVATLSQMLFHTNINEEESVYTIPHAQINKLEEDNNILIAAIRDAMRKAKEVGAEDVDDFLIERLRAHRKHGWMIASHAARQQTNG